MKNLTLLFIAFLLFQFIVEAQQITREQTYEPIFFKVNSHDPNFKNLPQKSFYKSKADWQYIIDTTWGPGLPLAQKQQIFNSYVSKLEEKFDGFESLGFTPATWDTFKTHYFFKIDSSTSRGKFSAIMSHLTLALRDLHTYAFDDVVLNTPLNPKVPLLILGGWLNVEHFGAVLTCSPDSLITVLRVVDNHPLNLEAGDIILGYDGVKWTDILVELLQAELPILPWGGGSASSYNDALLLSAGMNWHLFDTIDIVKYNSSDTVHSSVLPLLNLNLPPMLNNEQIDITNIPFPDYFNNEAVSYGMLPNTNIGYIYVCSEAIPTFSSANQQFNSAVSALQNTDALIIDMRWNEGGYAFWQEAFNILNNETIYDLEWSFRCNPGNWFLCPDGDTLLASVSGSASGVYERPIAVLIGPTCVSNGDINAYRLKKLSMVKTFGKSSASSLGYNEFITNFTAWTLRYSIGDMHRINQPGYYLNRKEFPIDFPVWHNKDDVALGKDAVVEKALDWINNLVYAHDLKNDKSYYIPGTDSIILNAQVENPNSHPVSIVTYIKDLEGSLIDSVFLNPSGDPQSETWTGVWDTPIQEDFFKIDITANDLTTSESFTLKNIGRFTTAGPIGVESIEFTHIPQIKRYSIKAYLKNNGNQYAVENISALLTCDDPWLVSLNNPSMGFPNISPGDIVSSMSTSTLVYNDSTFPGYFNLSFAIQSVGYRYWTDTILFTPTGVDDVQLVPTEFSLSQNYPNPFNPVTTIKYQIPHRSRVSLKIYDILGSEIVELVNEEQEVGYYNAEFNAAKLSSGVYFYRLQSGDFVQTRKMILLK
jgi:hypothetical protein